MTSILICAAAAAVPTGQTPGASSPQTPAFRAETRLVRVTVVVHDNRSQPVTDLTADDFEILENAKPQPIAFFLPQSRELPSPTAAASMDEFTNAIAPAATRGVSVILFDRLNTPWSDQGRARANIFRYLSRVDPNERIGLYVLESDRVDVIHDFTRDASSLVRALNRVQGLTSREAAVAEEPAPEFGSTGFADIDARMDAAFQRLDLAVKGEFLKKRAESTLMALEAVARHLSGIEGRKNLIWVSSSFPVSFNDGFGTRTFYREVSIATRAMTDADVAIYPVDARGLVGAFASHPSARQQTFNTLNTVMGPLDSMKMIAERTGGRVYYNTNDLDNAIRRAVDDSRQAYVIGYYPSNDRWDGRFRQITVRTRRRGLDVRHRGGYLALPPPPQDSPSRRGALQRALRSPVDWTGLAVSVRLERLDDRSVNVVIRPDVSSLLVQRGDAWLGQVDLAIAQALPDGTLVNVVERGIPLEFTADERRRIADVGLTLTHQVALIDNTHELRVAVRDPGTGLMGSVIVPGSALRRIAGGNVR